MRTVSRFCSWNPTTEKYSPSIWHFTWDPGSKVNCPGLWCNNTNEKQILQTSNIRNTRLDTLNRFSTLIRFLGIVLLSAHNHWISFQHVIKPTLFIFNQLPAYHLTARPWMKLLKLQEIKIKVWAHFQPAPDNWIVVGGCDEWIFVWI